MRRTERRTQAQQAPPSLSETARALMPSATAMLDTLLPAAAGTPVAAPGVQDAATAGLFSSKLSEVLQAANAVEAPTAEATVEPAPLPVGRLSLPSLTLAAEADPVEAVTPPAAPDGTIVEADEKAEAPALLGRPAPAPVEDLSADAVETAPDAALAAASFLAPAPLPAPPAPVAAETSDLVAESGAAQPGQMAPSPALPAAAAIAPAQTSTQQIQGEAAPASDIVEDLTAPLASPVTDDATVAPEISPTAAPPEAARARAAEDQSFLPVQGAEPRPASTVSITPQTPVIAQTPVAPVTQPVLPQAVSAQTVEAEQIAAALKAAAPMVQGEVKVTTQSAVTRQAAQTVAAVAAQLAAAEAAEPTETDPLTGETTDATDTAPQTVLQTSTIVARSTVSAVPQSTPETSPRPQVNARALPVETAATPTAEQTPSTAHVSMAEAGTSQAQPSVAVAPDAAGSTAPAIDVAAAPLDPSAPVETPTEARALETTAAAAQPTNASALSRATIETTAHLAAQIARKLEGRSTRFDMVLTPEDLGRVDVSLEIGSDGQLAARLAFDNPAAAADLRGRADELRRQLQDAGFQIAQDSLDFTQRDTSSGGGFGDRQQQRQSLFAGGSRLAAQADLPPAPLPGAWTNHSQTRDRVDVRV